VVKVATTENTVSAVLSKKDAKPLLRAWRQRSRRAGLRYWAPAADTADVYADGDVDDENEGHDDDYVNDVDVDVNDDDDDSGAAPPLSRAPFFAEAFVTFEWWQGGFNNKRQSIELAAAVAVRTKRTLVGPIAFFICFFFFLPILTCLTFATKRSLCMSSFLTFATKRSLCMSSCLTFSTKHSLCMSICLTFATKRSHCMSSCLTFATKRSLCMSSFLSFLAFLPGAAAS
jgi:hypothetical protein